jgi:hypothetical protein
MKKVLGLVVLGFVLGGNAYAEDFVYNCKFNTSYKNDTGKKLKSTKINLTIKNSGTTLVNIYDEAIGLSRGMLEIISTTDRYIRAVTRKTDFMNAIIINKNSGYIQYVVLYGSGETEINYGSCKKK